MPTYRLTYNSKKTRYVIAHALEETDDQYVLYDRLYNVVRLIPKRDVVELEKVSDENEGMIG